VRFNESIDQALTESVRRYSEGLTRAWDLFEGVLAHDLRSPLHAMIMSAGYLLQTPDLSDTCVKAALRIQGGGARMQLLIQDLLDFARTRLGDVLTVNPRPANMKEICERAIDEVGAFNPDRRITSTFRGDLNGLWDAERLVQVFTNLMGNAVRHGDPDSDILVDIRPDRDGVTAAVLNHGPAIPPETLPAIFDPLRRSAQGGISRGGGASVGLGLYIVRQIVIAHDGSVTVSSNVCGTTFTVHVPRRIRSAPR
jgi:signal transduction histidine kinase